MSISSRLRELRLQRGESLQYLANAVGVSKPYLWGLETGRNANPTLEFLQRMASYYGIAVAEIIEPGRQDIEEDTYFWSLFNAVKPLGEENREILLETAKTMHKIHKRKTQKE